MAFDDLAAMYGRLRHTLTAEPATAPQTAAETATEPATPLPSVAGCRHPRRLWRVDTWTDPNPHNPGTETVTVRTVCCGCDETIGYHRHRTTTTSRR